MAARTMVNPRALVVSAGALAWFLLFTSFVISGHAVRAERPLLHDKAPEVSVEDTPTPGFLVRAAKFLWQSGKSSYEPVWPEMEFGWKLVVGSIVGFFGAALGSVGGVGGGGIFVPMLTLIIGFDPKSSTAISKCTSTKALFKGIETWKKETVMRKATAKLMEAEVKHYEGSKEDYKPLPSGPAASHDERISLTKNIYWKELSMLLFIWIAFLAVQIIKTYTKTCSVKYWILNSLQVPIACSVTLFEAIALYKGKRVIASKGKEITNWKLHQILLYSSCGIIAGIVGGLLGLGGGFILGPLFLELGIPPQVASATSTFAMTFSSSMSVVQYYLLKRFPVPYAAYFVLVATVAAIVGQHVVRRIIAILGRTSIIIFILALTIFVSAISLGGVGISNLVEKLENQEYMGFESLCYES
ncbi:sulfite exporter TauE/SafE family protein 3-like isoform X2 [Syzygium oleosum]|uniref:sulfite exporter TauE/SafE family protein 3-like isoform X2 n=1 Tax=Syzygium oleosum TaxID=219896 RepID=UPI0024BAA2A7|nr:sulfite exporter TauE/SafE family protein 3-like isoform X2 [Syzygium oleosum]